MTARKIFLIVIFCGFIAIMAGVGAVFALFYFDFVTNLQELRSPDAKHMAVLVRMACPAR